ncbi:MCP four helix bundle domain-containing protein, partial [Thioalkalivibrio sp. XN279]|uniref:MCP four helix bundle domain-containing protein n=1 Tax=Thioalkalivibrio sp. XN279 TaxID=2714953 RepID=UPI00140AE4EC
MKNLKIGLRLGIAFALVLVLMAVISLTSINRIGLLAGEVDILVTDRYVKTVWANNVLDEINVTARAVRNAVIATTPEETGNELNRLPAASATITENLDKLQSTITSDEGVALLGKVQAAREEYVGMLNRITALLRAGQDAAAAKLLLGGMRNAQANYMGAINGLIAFQGQLMTEDGIQAHDAAEQGRLMIIILGAAALIIGTLLAFLITLSITRPVAQVSGAARKMAQGDFDFELKSDAKDEIGEVVRAVGEVQGSVKAMVADANMLAKAAVEGRLATRADADKHEGEFRDIVAGVNNTLDA